MAPNEEVSSMDNTDIFISYTGQTTHKLIKQNFGKKFTATQNQIKRCNGNSPKENIYQQSTHAFEYK